MKKDIPDLEELGVRVDFKVRGGKIVQDVKPTLLAAARILQYFPEFGDNIWFDEFALKPMWKTEELTDFILSELAIEIDCLWGVDFPKKTLLEAYRWVAQKNQRNPLKELIFAEKWDRVPRLETWLIDYFGVEDNPLHRAYSKKFMIGAVGRALFTSLERPIKHDVVLVIYGKQGIFKSTGIAALSLKEKYFGDLAFDMSNPDKAFYATQGKFIYELKEMARRPKDKRVEKGYLDTKIDAVRLPYQATVTRTARTCVFIGSTNRMDLLNDSSGSRRFWPVVARGIVKHVELKENALQIWREAAYLYQKDIGSDYHHWLSPNEEEERIKSNELFSSVHPWKTDIENICKSLEINHKTFYSTKSGETISLVRLQTGGVIITPNLIMKCLELPARERSPKNRTTIEMIMMELGYVRRRIRMENKRIITWRKEQ